MLPRTRLRARAWTWVCRAHRWKSGLSGEVEVDARSPVVTDDDLVLVGVNGMVMRGAQQSCIVQ